MDIPFKKDSQNYRLLMALQKGPLYNYEIAKQIGSLAHTARTRDLRKHGYPVITEKVPDKSGVYISYLK